MDEERIETYHALEKAAKAFETHLRKLGYDRAYWDLRLTAWGLTSDDFTPLWKIDLDLRESKNQK